jgi:hypothetical protein
VCLNAPAQARCMAITLILLSLLALHRGRAEDGATNLAVLIQCPTMEVCAS